jgi:hypothetical protein
MIGLRTAKDRGVKPLLHSIIGKLIYYPTTRKGAGWAGKMPLKVEGPGMGA